MPLPQGESSPKLEGALAARLRARVHPGWNRVYYPLASLVVLTASLSLYQNHELRKVYTSQIEFITTTNHRIGRLLELRLAAQAIDDAGIDIINLADIKDAHAKSPLRASRPKTFRVAFWNRKKLQKPLRSSHPALLCRFPERR